MSIALEKTEKGEVGFSDKRIRDEGLDFTSIPAGEGVNMIHSYPAMFHPRVVRHFISQYSQNGDLVLDPFLGSGVAAVESAVAGRMFIGYDLNPLAVLIAKVRTTPLSERVLRETFQRIVEMYEVLSPTPPDFPNIDFWFSEESKKAISKIMVSIEHIADEDVQRFFKVTLSETIRLVSETDPNEFKLVRRKKPCTISVIESFKEKAEKNIKALVNYYSTHQICYSPEIQRKNILIEEIDIENESVSLLITSPPYGDSQTTVAYGQFSRLSLQWLGLPYNVDKDSLGAKAVPIKNDIPSVYLYRVLDCIHKKDPKRAKQVYSFYADLYQCMVKLVPKIKKSGYLIFVVGNRTVKGVQLPTDVICAEMLEHLGCRHLETRVRQIGNKRMPSLNSPTNISGKKSPTMRYEYIVVCRKEF